jgi:ribonucleoside-triphosphate reductase
MSEALVLNKRSSRSNGNGIGHPNVGGKFATELPDRIISLMKETRVPWGPVGYVTYKRTYSRHLDDNDDQSPKEEYWETLKRCINGVLHIGGAFTLRELEVLAGYLIQLKCNFSGRGLWQLGTKTVDRIGGDSLQACWHVRVNEPVHPFAFTFDELMLGGGVGFSIMPEDVYEIPRVKYNVNVNRVETFDCDYIVPDNREGWVELLKKILKAFFFTGKDINYNPDCLRARGQRIKSFGGTASGSEELVRGLAIIVGILKSRVGQKLRPIDALDIQNILGMIVVAGNVRRSAQIAKGSGRDREFLLAKYWDDGALIPKWRQQSNNTVAETHLEELLPEFWWGYDVNPSTGLGKGEPYGLYNPYLAANYGRLADGLRLGYNSRVCGPNPCGEIMLESDEACNLGELYLTNLKDGNEFHTAAELMFKCQKIIGILPFLYAKTNAVVSRNVRVGLGVTGVFAAHHLNKPEMFDSVYKHIVEVDREYTPLLGPNIPFSIAYTTVKPSGTAAKLPIGCTPGANPAYSLHSVLRITFASDSPMLPTLKEYGYPMEPKLNQDGTRDFNVTMVSFPVAYPEGTPTEGISAIEQLDNVVMLQRWWSDNAVSATVQYKPEELPGIKDWLFANYKDNLKSIAFCLHSGHGFKQPPNEAITKEQYQEFVRKVKPLESGCFGDGGDLDDTSIDGVECIGDRCGIK